MNLNKHGVDVKIWAKINKVMFFQLIIFAHVACKNDPFLPLKNYISVIDADREFLLYFSF